jgi:Secretion system C-terminal sorting domain
MQYIASVLCFCIFAMLPRLHAQDTDQDGIADALEAALALRFSPEWRYHAEVAGDGSSQNRDEVYYPASMEFFHQKVKNAWGKPPQLIYNGKTLAIPDFEQLSKMVVPGTAKSASDVSWGGCNETLLLDFPEKLEGDPKGFPTYFRCYKAGDDRVGIAYLLFYPYDYKGKFLGLFEFGNHRGDWEGINVVISGIADFSSPASAAKGVVEQVKYSGHGPKRYLKKGASQLCLVDGTHPKVYLSWGSHTPYPEPGEWHNYKVDFPLGVANQYDDFFHGNGLVAQGWSPKHPLINLGEAENPLVGWLKFAGLWGSDINNGNASPSGPVCKSVWTHDINGWTSWAEAQLATHYSAFWEKSFEPTGTKCNTVAMDEPKITFSTKLWPNPMTTQLTIALKEAPPEALIARFFDINARLQLETVLTEQVASIDVSRLPAGIYLLQMGDKRGRLSIFKVFKL